METNSIITIVGLFFGIWFTFVNIFRATAGQNVPWPNMLIMAAGWTAFISTMWLLP